MVRNALISSCASAGGGVLSKPANVAAVQTLSSSWIDDMFDGIAPSYDPNGPATAKPLVPDQSEAVTVTGAHDVIIGRTRNDARKGGSRDFSAVLNVE